MLSSWQGWRSPSLSSLVISGIKTIRRNARAVCRAGAKAAGIEPAKTVDKTPVVELLKVEEDGKVPSVLHDTNALETIDTEYSDNDKLLITITGPGDALPP